ncbi:putative zinc ribbon protein [Mobilisporobacter senegalensis]|uniref:Putative zinc ribbon protein n=1 Tax=Mobilisporobacter senegalensis TaxID=1329262 RepID=A0A3N1XQS2_9FIRM|nr:zinc-ribbon domain-containing protein [Mobilisporobacter senegalensis]ROR28511.1 putative zinc ribbon protein [Mobilisporobacter senegalensis]
MRKSLLDWCHENHYEYLLEEWDSLKNGELDEKISYGSERKVHWNCNKGHSWIASVNSRTSTLSGCPYCSGRFPVKGETDLATTHKNLVQEWLKEKNGTATPFNVKASSHAKVWWKCKKCGHEWKALISSRTRGCGCPECGKKAISKSRSIPNVDNLLINKYPQLTKEWHFIKNGELTPETVSSGSHRKVWWQCDKGHEWETSIANRTKGRGCPYCSNKIIQAGFNDLETINPILAKEWHPTKNEMLFPTDVAPSSNKKVWWKCFKGHEWQATINNRAKRGCPECSRELRVSFPEKVVYYYVSMAFHDCIENYRPAFLGGKELDIFIPSLNIGIEYDGEAFHSSIENDMEKDKICNQHRIQLIRIREPNCPKLQGSSICFFLRSRKERDLEKIIVEVILKINEQTSAIMDDLPKININKDRKKIYKLLNYMEKKNSLAITHPYLMDEWNIQKNGDLTPAKVTSGSDKKVWWVCKNGHEWQASISHRVAGRGCPICNNRIVVKGINDIVTLNPNLMKEWCYKKNTGLNPTTIGKGSNIKAWWKCQVCGTEWKSYISARMKGSGCPLCLKNQLSKKLSIPTKGNSLAEFYPQIAAQWNYNKNNGLQPSEVSRRSGKKVWWICEKGHEWEATVTSRQKAGCPYCSNKKMKLISKI